MIEINQHAFLQLLKKSPEEVHCFLQAKYEEVTHKTKSIVYGNASELEVCFNSKRKVKSIISEGSDFLDALKDQYDKAVSNPNEVVKRKVLFSYDKISGSYKYKNKFQLIPLPEGGNQPEVDDWGGYPVILEYKVMLCGNEAVNSYREEKEMEEITLILNLVFRNGIDQGARSSERSWVITGLTESRYLQSGYIPNFDMSNSGFTIIEDDKKMNLKSIATHAYFLGSWEYHEGFFLPDFSESVIDIFFSLGKEVFAKFERSLYWSLSSRMVHSRSLSLSYMALITSIEALMSDDFERCSTCNRPIGGNTCEACKQQENGPTKKFREFMQEYGVGIEVPTLNEIYAYRSELSHGSGIMPNDLRRGYTSEMSFTPTVNHLVLIRIIKYVQFNWLMKNQSIS